jgi:hypothetical protein
MDVSIHEVDDPRHNYPLNLHSLCFVADGGYNSKGASCHLHYIEVLKH